MKVGETVPVSIAGQVVAQAKIEEVLSDRATLVVPATVVVMGIRTEFDMAPVDNSGTETIIDGVDRVPSSVEEVPPASEPILSEVKPEESSSNGDTEQRTESD